jgi:hypothetical protein
MNLFCARVNGVAEVDGAPVRDDRSVLQLRSGLVGKCRQSPRRNSIGYWLQPFNHLYCREESRAPDGDLLWSQGLSWTAVAIG